MKYGVKVIFTYSVDNDKEKFYEETIYMVEAKSFEDAYEKVEKYINKYDFDHMNPKNRLVKREKIELLDCFLAFEEEDNVQEIYSSTTKNKTSLSEEDFYNAITTQCDADELYDLRYKEFNKNDGI